MPARFTSARFVGRERELARLADALEAAVDGRSTTLLVAGSGGLGAQSADRRDGAPDRGPARAARRHPLPGATRAERRSLRPDRGRPRGVDRRVRRPRAGPGRRDGRRGAGQAPARNASIDSARIGLLPIRPTVTEPERRQTRMLESILGLLIRLGERTPVVLALEDLQSADAGTRALATFLARVSRPGPAVRPGDLPARRAHPQPSAANGARRDGRRRRVRRPS